MGMSYKIRSPFFLMYTVQYLNLETSSDLDFYFQSIFKLDIRTFWLHDHQIIKSKTCPLPFALRNSGHLFIPTALLVQTVRQPTELLMTE